MISENEITAVSKREKIGWGIVEKDYFLTLVLDAVSASTKEMHGNFVFKGGTAFRPDSYPARIY